ENACYTRQAARFSRAEERTLPDPPAALSSQSGMPRGRWLVGQTAKELREMRRKRYTHLLDSIFEECASEGITVGPDKAMDWMEGCLEKLVSDGKQSSLDETMPAPVSSLRFDFAAYRRDAHHYAVDQFYKTFLRLSHALDLACFSTKCVTDVTECD